GSTQLIVSIGELGEASARVKLPAADRHALPTGLRLIHSVSRAAFFLETQWVGGQTIKQPISVRGTRSCTREIRPLLSTLSLCPSALSQSYGSFWYWSLIDLAVEEVLSLIQQVQVQPSRVRTYVQTYKVKFLGLKCPGVPGGPKSTQSKPSLGGVLSVYGPWCHGGGVRPRGRCSGRRRGLPAWPSALCKPTGPLGRQSMASFSFDLKQPSIESMSMHGRPDNADNHRSVGSDVRATQERLSHV
ncbi:hypothetical protein THAOC_19280, partial [Thalassiosira oceanica]